MATKEGHGQDLRKQDGTFVQGRQICKIRLLINFSNIGIE
jgi:hypothetical protein